MSKPDPLPSMQALRAFESAARLASFTAAARELGSTQPAVSQQVFQLEAELGVPLFERSPRGVTLTDDGQRLYEAVRASLDTLRAATATLRARREHGTLTLATDFGFATYWLMPRLAGLKRVMPDVDVRVVTSQDFDAQRDHADIAILFGDGHWPSCTAARLFPETVTPVCSPAFRAAHPRVAQPGDLLDLPLLHVQPTRPERWLSWLGWFDAHGLAAPAAAHGVTFNSYALVIHAALLGEGVALGWTPLVDELVASRQLVTLVDAPVVTSRGYFLVRPPARPEPSAAPVFRRWLLDACALA
ncbi:LysR family transcriptional regulator [Burkholderia ubonensis]|uniref:choline sulfate utilization transcriptional regulator n=1 Tax=Burkholderia ubonensis TaxID=101571 RepID=UPI000757729C|nr:LysR family transcriptional regulator [Burkholderia ubonensis]KWI37639.1 LysR family transcriptional regulator [Burkholderia ubonensis]OJB21078.1 LysR family transcriptional regulator [Burkholderia ubonensis]